MKNTVELGEYFVVLSVVENWQRTCTVLMDRPLSAVYWNLEEMTGEKLLEELPELQLVPAQVKSQKN
jgi:hypothetical protein